MEETLDCSHNGRRGSEGSASPGKPAPLPPDGLGRPCSALGGRRGPGMQQRPAPLPPVNPAANAVKRLRRHVPVACASGAVSPVRVVLLIDPRSPCHCQGNGSEMSSPLSLAPPDGLPPTSAASGLGQTPLTMWGLGPSKWPAELSPAGRGRRGGDPHVPARSQPP